MQPLLFDIDKIHSEVDVSIAPTFSIIDCMSNSFRKRKRMWDGLKFQSDIGRKEDLLGLQPWLSVQNRQPIRQNIGTSIFNPVLAELAYKWFCPAGGHILDPFSGGCVRGLVADYLGYTYTGIDLSEEQVLANREQANGNNPKWLLGDADTILESLLPEHDFLFSCPPYFALEKYSDDPCDLSNMSDGMFKGKYFSIIKKGVSLLTKNALACFVVSDVRDKNGIYKGLPQMTVDAFKKAGFGLYNEIIIRHNIGHACMRAPIYMRSKKVVRVHENMLVFKRMG